MPPRTLRDPRAAAREALRSWERSADVWDDFEERGLDFSRDVVHGPALLGALGTVRGLRVLDVGCGQGRFTRELARAGASVTAVDWSGGMIRRARAHELRSPLGISYMKRDARTIGSLGRPGTFDRVVGCMSFMDMPGLPRVLRGAHRLLAQDGRLVFSVSHPMNTSAIAWDRGEMRIGPYFGERVGVTEWRMRRLSRPFDTIYWHRTFEAWFDLLRRTGFEVDILSEPRPSRAAQRAEPRLRGSARFPFFLVLGCRRVPVAGLRRMGRTTRRRDAHSVK
jgi:2-polyprenyl-3-methyl-5-hydroxy-6-metoxy-1,4-benzoquinol methylase